MLTNKYIIHIYYTSYFLANNKVYGCVVDMEDHLVRKDGGPFNFEEFKEHPHKYASNFSRQVSTIVSHCPYVHRLVLSFHIARMFCYIVRLFLLDPIRHYTKLLFNLNYIYGKKAAV